ncbi:hypothetical protein E4U56_002358 [Claviceps arundinis]|uniref:Uncharacterized protein n=1 Tax=Claviceps arundinis TaxID=1623583 RepID=A0A9P7SMY2_9HYPO|nr:hypothetical protein E4U56_002358 [Claviceps arundinis]
MPDPSHLVAQQVDDQIRRFQAGWIAAIEAVGRPSSGDRSAPWWTKDSRVSGSLSRLEVGQTSMEMTLPDSPTGSREG